MTALDSPLHRRRTDPVPRVIQIELPTFAELMTRSYFVGRVWWLWFWTKVVPDVFWFFTFLLVDKRGEGLSLTRFMAVAYTVLVFNAVLGNHPIGANVLWLALATFAVAFGKSTFTFLLARASLQSNTAQVDTTAKIDATVTTVTKDASLGWQPTP